MTGWTCWHLRKTNRKTGKRSRCGRAAVAIWVRLEFAAARSMFVCCSAHDPPEEFRELNPLYSREDFQRIPAADYAAWAAARRVERALESEEQRQARGEAHRATAAHQYVDPTER